MLAEEPVRPNFLSALPRGTGVRAAGGVRSRLGRTRQTERHSPAAEKRLVAGRVLASGERADVGFTRSARFAALLGAAFHVAAVRAAIVDTSLVVREAHAGRSLASV